MSDMCTQEPLIRRAAVEDRWTEALRQHVAQCPDCAAAAAAAPFMTSFARVGVRRRALPDPAVIWLKAELLRGSIAADRIARPMNIAQISSYVLVAAGWAALLTWKWEEIQSWMLSFTPAQWVSEAGGPQQGIPFAIVVALLTLSSLTAMLTVHAIVAEE